MDTVLIVDDSSFIVEGLISFLKKKYRTLAAYGGAECLNILARETPSVIILDIMMEPMDGWETLARIRENPKTRTIPVLMFSAQKIGVEDAARHGIGVDDFIQKPVFPKKILDAIEKVLARRNTNQKVVQTWKAAGASQETIDEYLTLVTSLEVDLSLCQNMKMQCDLSHPEDTDQIQVRALIAAIEDRIQQERGMIESLVLAMNDILRTGPESGDPEGAGSLPVAGESFSGCQASGTGSDTLHEGRLLAEIPRKTTVAGQAATVPAEPGTADTDPADTPASTSLSVPRTVPSNPDHDATGTGQTREPAEPVSVPSKTPAGTIPVHEDIPVSPKVAAVPHIPPVSSTVDTGFSDHGESKSGQDGSGRTTNPDTAHLPDFLQASPLLPAYDPPVTEERKVIPADLDIPPDNYGNAPLTGAGTDVPMPWDTQREKKTQTLLSGQAGKNASVLPGSATRPHGIVARIISFVLSLLRKRN